MNPYPSITPGKSVGGGRYVVNKQLGDNPNFWLAHDEIDNKPVVLKFLAAELFQDPRGMEDLRNQIAAVSKLSHPNIAQIYDLHEAEGEQPFIIAEYVEGMNLPALQGMQPQRVFNWVFLSPLLKQILSAVQCAHENRLVQGSQKPSNIMLDRKGQIKVLDVGIAGILNNPLYGGAPTLMPYLSPQQVDGNSPEVTDDIYSLGVIVYEFLTSTVPFYTGDILPQIRSTPPQPIQQRLAQLKISNDIPQIVNSIVMSCLDKTPASRPQNIETIVNSIAVAEMEPQKPTAPAPVPVQAAQPIPRPAQSVIDVSVAPPPGGAQGSSISTAMEPSFRPGPPAKKTGKSPVLIAVVVLLVAIVAGGGLVFFMLNKQKSEETPATQQQQQPPPTPKANTAADDAARKEKEAKELEALKLKEQKQHEEEAKKAEEERKKQQEDADKRAASDKKAAKAARDAAELSKLAQRSESGFINLFNGQDLTGWSGDANYWDVEQSFITGKAGSGAPANLRNDLIWQGGTVEDFELRFQYRFRKMAGNTQAAAGVEYRAAKKDDGTVSGYHYEITLSGDNTGMLTSRERPTLAIFAEKARIFTSGTGHDKIEQSGQLEAFNDIARSLKLEDWNECVIIARGNHLIHKINGHVVADVTDDNQNKRAFSGALSLELQTGLKPAVFIQFRNIRLKKLK